VSRESGTLGLSRKKTCVVPYPSENHITTHATTTTPITMA